MTGLFLIESLNKLRRTTQCVKSVCIRSYSGTHFPAFGLTTERYSVSLRIQSERGEIRTRISPNTDIFYAVTKPLNAGESRIFHLKFVADSYIKIGKRPRQYMKSFRKNISVNILKPNFCSLHFREGQQIGLLEGNSIRDFAFLNLSIHFYSGDTRFYEYLF